MYPKHVKELLHVKTWQYDKGENVVYVGYNGCCMYLYVWAG